MLSGVHREEPHNRQEPEPAWLLQKTHRRNGASGQTLSAPCDAYVSVRAFAMRVVIVSDFGEVNGGAAKVAVTSARGLADAGVPVTFVCAMAPISPVLSHPRIAVRCLGFENVWGRNVLAAAMQGIWNG